MLLIFLGFDEISWAIRKSFDHCETFDCAFNYLSDAPIIAPGYIIMAGLKENEGAIISRDRWGPANITTLSEDRWYLAETNEDHFAGVCHSRCRSANKNMQALGQQALDLEKLKFDVLFQEPNFNHETLYQSMMVPSQGLFDTIITIYPTVPPREPVHVE